MKIQFSHHRRESGSVLLVCVLTTAIIITVLTSYLNLVNAQNLAIMRSQGWNSAIPVLEAGIEEALTHLYYNSGNLGINGWSEEGIQYSKFRQVGDNWAFVTISNVIPPVIYAHGYVASPQQTNYIVERIVQVNTRRDGLFTKGLVARGQITLNGNTALVDSFDSTDPNYSTNGLYISSKRKAGVTVASNSNLTNIISTGNANIYGRVATGPGGTVGIGPNGKVGNLGWQSTGTGIQPGYSSDDMNVNFPEVQAPFHTAATPPAGTGVNSVYDYVISTSGNWLVPSLPDGLLVRSNVHAVVVVEGSINISGNEAGIKIEKGGSLQLYVNGNNAVITGNGLINQNSNATNFFYWGLPANTNVSIKGNGGFTGVVYAPNADLTMSGGGNDVQDMIGASVSRTVRINGSFEFHYDESLGNLPFNRGFIVTAWNEL